jgi:rhamnulose-1-phosphate aldolase
MEPGSPQLAAATGAALRTSRVVVWARHGVLVAADGPDEAFDLVHMVEKAASICLRATVARASSRET